MKLLLKQIFKLSGFHQTRTKLILYIFVVVVYKREGRKMMKKEVQEKVMGEKRAHNCEHSYKIFIKLNCAMFSLAYNCEINFIFCLLFESISLSLFYLSLSPALILFIDFHSKSLVFFLFLF